MREFLNQEIHKFEDFLHIKVSSVLAIIVYGIVIYFVYKWVARLLNRAVQTNRLDGGRAFSIRQITKYILVIIFVFLSLLALHVNVKYFIALAPLLVGFGLGVQQVFNDLVSGIILLLETTIRVGDVVEVDGTVSRVKEIGLRTSKVVSRDGIVIILPNHKLVGEKLINWSNNRKLSRFIVKVSVAYGTEVEKVKKLLIESAWKHNKVITNPAPKVRFTDFGDSGLHFELIFWSNDLFDIEDVKSDLRFMIDTAFQNNNITIPFPQRDLHIVSGQFEKANPNR